MIKNCEYLLFFNEICIYKCMQREINRYECMHTNQWLHFFINSIRTCLLLLILAHVQKKLKSKIFLLHRCKSYTFLIVYEDKNVSLFINKVVFMQRKKNIHIYRYTSKQHMYICTILLVAFVTLKFATWTFCSLHHSNFSQAT